MEGVRFLAYSEYNLLVRLVLKVELTYPRYERKVK